ncbi:isopeptide-forming domain-containing fimbrial protein [Enterococcus larvae]|uniref:isopeptide-forming domain-containing fimbrial protein n=1 Tax=Enterococcus larvae TaxID=2794352 RepID=UPI003F3F0DCA
MNKRNRLYRIYFGLMILLCLFTGTKWAEAASILDAPNVSIPGSSEVVSGKYSFIAKFNNGVTKVSTFGEGWSSTKNVWGDGTEEAYFSFRPQAAQKGSNGVIYSNVGSYDGKIVDLKITVKDWTQFSKYQGYISYSKENISHFAQGYDFVDQVWEFVENGTGNPIKLSGFMTINDIDGGQGVQFSKETSAAIDKIYVSAADNWINYENINGEYKFFDSTGTSSENDDLFATFTFLYSDQSSFRFKWCVDKNLLGWDYETLNFEKDHVGDAGYQGAYFGYIAKKPLKTETLSPVKKNSDSDETLVDKNTLVDRNEVQTYTITHQVPDEYEEFYYKQYEFKDTLDPVFEVQQVAITDEKGQDCGSLFELSIEGNVVTYSAKADTLKKPAFYDHYYTTVIQAKIRPDAELAFSEGGILLNNTATVTIDGVAKTSNKTVTEVHQPELPDPVKRVVDEAGKNIDKKEVLQGEILVYEVDQKVNELNKDISAKYTEFSISDSLPKQVAFLSAKILKDGKEFEAEKISYDKNSHTVVFNGDVAFLKNMTMKAETYTLQIKTRVINEIGESEQIENTGKTSINKESQQTNKVENSTKLIKGSIIINKVTKQLTGLKNSKESDSDNSELIWEECPQEGVTYQVKANKDIVFPNGEVAAKAGHDYGTITTNEKGKAVIKELYEGEYALIEVAAPAGIQINSAPILVDLKQGSTADLSAVVKQEDALQEVELLVNKVFEQEDGSFAVSDGAVFGLFHGKDYKIGKDQTIKADTLVSEIEVKKGIGTYRGVLIPKHQYYVQEISTKNGYQINTEKFYFTYEPSSNDPVHKIELYENGFIENEAVMGYISEEAEGKELSENTEMLPIKNHRITENSIIKSIVKEDGQEVEHYDLLKSEETVIFKGLAYIGDNQQKNPLQISDQLPKGFTYISSKVLDEKGQDITNQTTIAVKNQQIILTINPEYAERLERTSIRWLITTTYKYSAEHQGQVFNNQLHLQVDGKKIPSNIVTLKPPTVGTKPFGMLPETGEMLGFGSLLGLSIVLYLVAYKYTKKEQIEL